MMGQSQVVAVPVDAVRTDKPAPYVQVVEAGTLRHVAVKTGLRGVVADTEMWAIEGLSEGAQIVRGSVGLLRDGQAVTLTGKKAL
jgi:hypothetical protein